MKIRYLLPNAYNIGGTIRTVLHQAHAMLAEGHDIELVSLLRRKDEPDLPIDPRITMRTLLDLRVPKHRRLVTGALSKVPTRVVPKGEARYRTFSLATDLAMRRYLRGLRDGAVVTARPALNLYAARYAPKEVLKVGQDHMHVDSYPQGLLAEMRAWYPRLDVLTALTEATAERYREMFGSRLRVERIPNMVRTSGATRATLDGTTIVAAGRLIPQKGFDHLVDAFAFLADDHPDWKLKIYGSGKQKQRLQRRVDEHGLTGQVHLKGRTTQLDEKLSKASMYVLSSRFEGFPMVLLEAMTHGLPVVAFDCPTGPSDMIAHGHNGLLVPPGDVKGLACAIEELMTDEVRRRELGAEAARSVTAYDTAAIVPQWKRLFED